MKEIVDFSFVSLKKRSGRVWIAVMAAALTLSLMAFLPGGSVRGSVLNASTDEATGQESKVAYGLCMKAKGDSVGIPAPALETDVRFDPLGRESCSQMAGG